MPVRVREYEVCRRVHGQCRRDVEEYGFLNGCGVVDGQLMRYACATIMSADVEFRVTQLLHQLELVKGERGFGIFGVGSGGVRKRGRGRSARRTVAT